MIQVDRNHSGLYLPYAFACQVSFGSPCCLGSLEFSPECPMLQSSFVEAQTIRLVKLLDQKWSLCMAPYGWKTLMHPNVCGKKNTQHDVSPMICSSTWFWVIVFTLCLFLLDPHHKITNNFCKLKKCHSYLWIRKKTMRTRPQIAYRETSKSPRTTTKDCETWFILKRCSDEVMIYVVVFFGVLQKICWDVSFFFGWKKKHPSKNH